MRNWLTVLPIAFLLAGCGKASMTQEAEQQRLLLELTKANAERLAELTGKEEELKSGSLAEFVGEIGGGWRR